MTQQVINIRIITAATSISSFKTSLIQVEIEAIFRGILTLYSRLNVIAFPSLSGQS